MTFQPARFPAEIDATDDVVYSTLRLERDRAMRRLCARGLVVWKQHGWALTDPPPPSEDGQRLRDSIARRNEAVFAAIRRAQQTEQGGL